MRIQPRDYTNVYACVCVCVCVCVCLSTPRWDREVILSPHPKAAFINNYYNLSFFAV